VEEASEQQKHDNFLETIEDFGLSDCDLNGLKTSSHRPLFKNIFDHSSFEVLKSGGETHSPLNDQSQLGFGEQ
jgi:hypothetical protein